MFSKPHLKSFLLLLFLDGGSLSFCFYLLPIKYFIFILVFLVILNIYLLFFSEFLFIKTLQLSPLLPGQFPAIQEIWEEYKISKKTHCYIADTKSPFTCAFSNSQADFAVFSKGLLEILTKEEVKAIVYYYLQSFSTGYSFFLTLISYICWLIFKLLIVIELPFRLIKKNPSPTPFCFPFVLKAFSLISGWIFFYLDKKTQQKLQGRDYPHVLWKTQSLLKMENFSLPVWMAPVFLGNLLTLKSIKWYLSFQPKIRARVKALIGSYPP